MTRILITFGLAVVLNGCRRSDTSSSMRKPPIGRAVESLLPNFDDEIIELKEDTIK